MLQSFEGSLYKYEDSGDVAGFSPTYFDSVLVRENYEKHHSVMRYLSDVKATLRAGPYTLLGGYPLYFITEDGAALSFDTVRAEWQNVAWDWINKCSTGWRVVGCTINYEDGELRDDHTGERIESAYAD